MSDLLAGAIRNANDSLDWIEQRDGPLPDDGYARIETSVGVVRALGRETTVAGDEAQGISLEDLEQARHDIKRGMVLSGADSLSLIHEIERLRERVAALEAACYEEVPQDVVRTISGFACRICGWDADPTMPDTHAPSCVLYVAALAGQPADGGA